MNKNIYIVLGLLSLILDQAIKFIVINTPLFDNGVFIFGGTFGIHKFINQNFSWSLPLSNEYSIVLMILVMIILVWVCIRHSIHPIYLILGGAFSNLIDRIIHNGVIDYIIVPWGGVINLADVVIFIGVILLIFNFRNKELKVLK